MRTRYPAAAWLCLAAAFGVSGAEAHESWVEPSAFEIESDHPIGVRICIADGLEGRALARDPWRIARFVALDSEGEVQVVGLEGAEPAGALRLTRPGSYVIAYQSERDYLQVPAAKFESFLQEEGLEHIVSRRTRQDAQPAAVREAYSRYMKALVQVGGTDPPADRPIGMTLELIAETGNPEPAPAEQFRLLFRDAPLAGALVVATRLGTADPELHARTDVDGRVRFALRDAGLWRIAAVHMTEAPRSIGADWESFWASLALEIPATAVDARPDAGKTRTPCANRAIQERFDGI